ALVSMLSSCLKNNSYYTDFSSAAASVQLPLAARNSNKLVTFSFDASAGTVKVPIYVNVASPSTPSTATTVKLGIDTAYLRTYNSANGTNFEVLPDSVYTTTGWDRTVPAGQRLDSTVATINISKINLSHNYVLPVTIVSSSLPIEQWNHLFMGIAVKNKYDGIYKVTGSLTDATVPTITGNYPFTAKLITSGPSSVYFDPHPILSNGASSYYGSFAPAFTFDPATNKVTSVVNAYGQPAANGRSAALDPSGINAYDPATKTIKVSYFMLQPGTNIRTRFTEVFTYQGPR
ncbi:MAG: DUF1735 domain-containing protein, partial [Flavisolibacter sp.]